MKRNITTILMLVLLGLSANSQTWLWERNDIETYHTYGNATATDAHGNVYVAGHFFGPLIRIGNFMLTNTDQVNAFPDCYVAKYDPMGNVLWAKSFGGDYYDIANAIAVDAQGSVYVTGRYASTSINFGTSTITNTAHYYYDLFLVKYDALGNEMWAQTAGGTMDDCGTALTTDVDGNVYMTGYYKSPILTIGNFSFGNAGSPYEDFFVAVYDPTGNCLRAYTYGSNGGEIATAIALDANKNIYLTGGFSSPALHLGTFSLLLGTSIDNMFIVKLDSMGIVQWANSAGMASYNYGSSLCVDNNDNIYVAGYYNGQTITFGAYTLTNAGQNTHDIFLTKFKSTGIILWAKTAGGPQDDAPTSVVTDGTNIFMTGTFSSPMLNFGTFHLTNVGNHNIFVTEYDPMGNSIFAKSVRGSAYDQGSALATDANNNLYVAGSNSSDTLVFDTDSLFSGGNYTMFIAKLSTLTTGIPKESIGQNGFSLYPNPNNGSFSLNTPFADSHTQLLVKDLSGRTVYSYSISSEGNHAVSLPVSSGIYFWEITSKERMIGTGKISVMK